EILFEAYGPGGVAIIIEGIADNKNRALGEIKQALNQNNGKLIGEGGVRWMFERKGVIVINPKSPAFADLPAGKAGASAGRQIAKEELEMLAIEAGATDIYWQDDLLDIYTAPESLESVKKNLDDKGIKVDSSSLEWIAKEEVPADEKTKNDCQKLFEALDELESVQDVYYNIKL
ncbi:MAG: YebC/PmpR family DNA-binding transcriptional regulator, partial [Candidatus Wildermuthbacteria bacterium]|nr:YebC/PmpR family DNA-binding transcriptional regulator [Candidatus Wildermuthbacteria bacterium]